ncbi:unnamed protein product [Meganyctiphanes norvegica]|uniref:Uncharacterized protein n=1 Tax=Meganyctiphanes norvegica TaxID=48144 RepID=A0AAV2RF51_MEGNR
MRNFRTTILLLCINAFISCRAAFYELDQEDFADYIDYSDFKVWTYDEVISKNYTIVPEPPAGPHSSVFILTDYVQPQYTDRYKFPATGDVTFEGTFFCDSSISEFEVRFSYPWQDHFFVMCGPSSGSTPNKWQTKTKKFPCVSAQGCTEIEVWIYGITVGPGNVIALQNLKMVTGDSTIPPTAPTESTTPHTTTEGPTEHTTPTTEHTTPTTTPTTTRAPGEGLNCYSCVACPSVDENTPTLQLDEYTICVTSFFGGNAPNSRSVVVRGGSSENHVDGECFMHDGMMDCYCGSNLCNDQNVINANNYFQNN